VDLGHSEAEKIDWYRHWVADGFRAVEATLATAGLYGSFALDDRPTLAEAVPR
jgi:maleylacetoacetate isomerase/maleylpyruvate isomerase